MSQKDKDVALAVAQGVLAALQYGVESDRIMAEIRSWPDTLTPQQIDEAFEKLSASEIAAARAKLPPGP